ncbi:hypothetical protein [Thioflavicoccus mobilis]|uniref:hypothetical protein n=1 Tax=Thioflavicoccus mobilis TaxID=80679 RepID=UPI0005A086AF|nr:hypothetical protein [Thioflavicoccus mobilis]
MGEDLVPVLFGIDAAFTQDEVEVLRISLALSKSGNTSSWMLKLSVTRSVPMWPVLTQCCIGEAMMLGISLAIAKGTAQFI